MDRGVTRRIGNQRTHPETGCLLPDTHPVPCCEPDHILIIFEKFPGRSIQLSGKQIAPGQLTPGLIERLPKLVPLFPGKAAFRSIIEPLTNHKSDIEAE